MKFFNHSDLSGRHAFLSASKYSWIRYDEDQLYDTFQNHMSAALGTRLHEHAKEAILLKRRQINDNQTFNAYVNDAIGFRMTPEVVLYAGPHSFGTADAVSFHDNVLRISDLKNGSTPAKFDQLLIYACYFLIEYQFKFVELDKIILRIYQNDEILEMEPTLDVIQPIIDKIFFFEDLLTKWEAQLNE